MAKRPPFNLAGTVPGDHGLETIAERLREHPRDRVWAVVEFYSSGRGTDTPMDEEDQRHLTITILALEPVTVPDDVNTLAEIRDRARSHRPGQATLDEMAETGGEA